MLRSLMTVSGLTLLSRVLGLLRDAVINNFLGVGATSDAWNSAFQFPNLFRRVFGEGAFNAAFVPMYSAKLEGSEEEAFGFASRTIVWLFLALAGLFGLCMIFTWPIMKVFNWGFEAEKLDLTVSLARVTMGYLVFVCLLSAFSGLLNTHKKFFAPAFSYAFLNMAFLGGLLGVVPFLGNPEWVLVWSLLAAGALQLAVVVVPAYKLGFRVKLKKPRIDDDLKKLGFLMLPGLLSAGVQQLNLLVGSWVVSFQDGGKTIIYNADRINQLPLGLIGIAFGVVLLPEITRLVKNDKLEEARDSISTGMMQAMFLTLPAMIGMVVLGEQMLFGLFKGGKFTAEDARVAGQALMVFALGCPAYVLTRVLQPGYFAREDTKTPMKYTLVSAVTNAVLCLVAFSFLNGTGKLHIGCAAATSVAGWVNVVLLAIGLKKQSLLVMSKPLWLKLFKMLIVSIVMGAVVAVVAHVLDGPIHSDSRLYRMMVLILVIGLGSTVYFTVSHFWKVITVAELKKGFKRG